MKNKYEKNIRLNKIALTEKLFESSEFKQENISSYGNQFYMRASINNVFIKKLENGEIEFSENRGLSGPLEISGKCKLKELNKENTRMNLVFMCGNYNIKILTNIFLILSILGILILFINIGIGILLFFLSLIVLILMWTKKVTISTFLKKIEIAIGKENIK